jgi:hypothetical protein
MSSEVEVVHSLSPLTRRTVGIVLPSAHLQHGVRRMTSHLPPGIRPPNVSTSGEMRRDDALGFSP